MSEHPKGSRTVTTDESPTEREFSVSFTIELDGPNAADLFGWLTDGEVCATCGASFDNREALAAHVERDHGLRR